MKTTPHNTSTRALLVSSLLVLGAALGARRGLLESGILPHDCNPPAARGALCALKTTLTFSCAHQRIGWFSLTCSLLSLAATGLGDVATAAADARRHRRRRVGAWGGWLSGLAGLVLYGADPASVGALVSLLVLTS